MDASSCAEIVPTIVKLQIFVSVRFLGRLQYRRLVFGHVKYFSDFYLQQINQLVYNYQAAKAKFPISDVRREIWLCESGLSVIFQMVTLLFSSR